MAAAGGRQDAGAGHAGAARRRPDGGRNPAPLGRRARARQPLLRLAGGGKPAAAAGAASPHRTKAAPCPRSASDCAHAPRRLADIQDRRFAGRAGAAGSSHQTVVTDGLGSAASPLPHSACHDSDYRLERTDGKVMTKAAQQDTEAETQPDRHPASAVVLGLARGRGRRGRRDGATTYWSRPDTAAAQTAAGGGEVSVAELMAPGPLGDQVSARQRAGHDHRICLDDLSALRPFPRDHLSGDEEEIHRYRQGPLHLPRVPARSAGRRPAPCWRAAPATTNISR